MTLIAGDGQLYNYVKSISNTESLGVTNDVSTYTAASSNVTFNVTPQKIGEGNNGGTLYILNCSDANGWWITGYTAQSLAQDLYNLLSPYFVNTIMVQNTNQLAQILSGTPLQTETVQNAVIINTFGEAVPIPSSYASQYSPDFAKYPHLLGQKVSAYNWTWASIVGYPFYYVSNTGYFSGSGPNDQNAWGIFGMKQVSVPGINAFLRGIDGQTYQSNSNGIASDVGVVTFTSQALDSCNYYGIYPSSYQTSTRALSNSILQSYHLTIAPQHFQPCRDKQSRCNIQPSCVWFNQHYRVTFGFRLNQNTGCQSHKPKPTIVLSAQVVRFRVHCGRDFANSNFTIRFGGKWIN